MNPKKPIEPLADTQSIGEQRSPIITSNSPLEGLESNELLSPKKSLAHPPAIDQRSSGESPYTLFDNQIPKTIDELCAFLRASKSTIYEYNRQGIPRFPVGKSWRYMTDEVIEWLKERGKRRLYPQETRFDPHIIRRK
jgi:predicted DNA-binding transcriptional regulator AlpA